MKTNKNRKRGAEEETMEAKQGGEKKKVNELKMNVGD